MVVHGHGLAIAESGPLAQNCKYLAKHSRPKIFQNFYHHKGCDVGTMAKALVKIAPDRMLWATNWPHPTPGLPKPDDIWMLDMLLDWVADEATRTKVLVNNPARLYGFA